MVADQFAADTACWESLARPLPEWYARARLGIFVHWGPYSVPAWAEPVAEFGTLEPEEWFRHNPYAEWYFNTIRLEGSPAQLHHHKTYGDAPYDDFLDAWHAESFNPDDLIDLVACAGAGYLVLTTKHHDGVALWEAPGTGDRNTVGRGPHRDLVAAFADACRARGIRFGTYYSGGLDWYVRPFPPHGTTPSFDIDDRPRDLEYAAYAAAHLRDLIRRYRPDVLWNDIEWPDAGKNFGPDGIGTVFREYYTAVPDGVVNDRWNVPHRDFVTSEYQHRVANESASPWENCRGLGLSFGYNQMEGPEHALSGPEAIRHLVDVACGGGRLLLGVGPMADGSLPAWQTDTLRAIGAWTAVGGELLQTITPDAEAAPPLGAWVRTARGPMGRIVFVDKTEDGPAELTLDAGGEAELLTPEWARMERGEDGQIRLSLAKDRPGPTVLALPSP